jgi:two-component system cell cycle sensor histidine kinase/response regulator CckA
VMVIIRDISKQIRSEQLLRESNEKFEKIFQASPLMVSLSSVDDGVFLEVNETAVRLCGFSRDEVIGKSSTEIGLISQSDRDRIGRALKENGRVDDIELLLHRKDGTAFFCSYGGRIVSVAGKECLLSVSEDITDKMESEERLRTLSRAVEQSPASVVITDTNGVIQYVNPKFTEVAQYGLDEVVGHRPSILKTGATSQEAYSLMWKTILSGHVWHGEFCNRKKNGELFWESASISPIVDKEGNIVHFVAVKEDITEKKEAEARRADLERQLFQAQKMEGIGTLAAGIAHDFNNILNTIVGSASLIEENPEQAEKVRQRISRVIKSAERGTQVVKQLMTLARKTSLQRRATSINDMLEEILRLLEETFPKTIEIQLSLSPSLPLIDVDPNQLHQVVLNLCSNARDAMPSGGELAIETSIVRGDELRMRHREADSRSYVEVKVKDTGDGIEDAVLKRIFDPFFTTKDVGKGTGLGLSVAHAIIESHHGFIEVASTIGVGSEFRIYLPAVDRPDVPLPKAEPETSKVTGGNETILFIDDDEHIRDMGVEFLHEKGYTVITAAHGIEGVEMYSRHAEDIAVVMSDFGLPKINGEEVYRRIRTINPNVPFILLTGLIEPEKKSELISLGIRDVVEKPYKPADVLLKIREVLDRST